MTASRKQPNLDDYRSMMKKAHAPVHLQCDVLAEAAAIRAQATPEDEHPQPTPHAAANKAPVPRAFAAKRSRMKNLAIAACFALVAGVGIMAIGPLVAQHDPIEDAQRGASENYFQMAAFADEGGALQKGPVALDFEDFFPVRASVGPRYDADIDSYTGDIDSSRSYNLNLTCTGSNIASLTYRIEGEGVSFNNWQLTEAAHEAKPDIGTVMATNDQSSEFTIPYENQDMSSTDSLHHEIYLNYTLDGALIDAWNECKAVTSQNTYSGGFIPEDQRVASVKARETLDLALALHDATVISKAKLILTATFTDGSTQSKTYRLAPVDNFEQAYSEYLESRRAASEANTPRFPVLYTLEEIS
ncbi:hypothetical protein ACTQZK_10635 [Paraeggerthella sp. LCP19S3_G8]|uniref:hypothetical protein n=1 Tax=Paraeggerthella sp. LCP19S3_G8 TaxID=3440248 RepID=UPI002A8E9FBC|nr:hypothetical protein [Paraeggerthella sp.]